MHAQNIMSAMFDIDTNGAIIELTQLTQLKCYCSQCSVLESLNPPTKSDLACGLAESRILNPWGLTRKAVAPSQSVIYFQVLTNCPIMPAYAPMLEDTYYA